MKIEAIMDEKHNNRLRIKFSELTDKDFMYGEQRNFSGRERRQKGTGKIVNSKGSRHFALKVTDEQFLSDPLFEELVRRNYPTWELKPNPEYEQYEVGHAIPIKIRYAHDPENPWKDPKISTFDGEKIDDLIEEDLVDLDHYKLLGGTVECHSYDGDTGKCSLYLDDAIFEIRKPQRENIRDKYRAMIQHDESEEEPIPFN